MPTFHSSVPQFNGKKRPAARYSKLSKTEKSLDSAYLMKGRGVALRPIKMHPQKKTM